MVEARSLNGDGFALGNALLTLRGIAMNGRGYPDIEITLPESQHRELFSRWTGAYNKYETWKPVFSIYGIVFRSKPEEPALVTASHWGMFKR